ncbi:hypothetical protein JCM10213_003292 [Rhodosporidiobolus nylandii]
MPVPPLPNELITSILEHLHADVVSKHSQEDLPDGSGLYDSSIFLPATRVNKMWRSLALPFYYRNIGPAWPHATLLRQLKQNDAGRHVQMLSFRPRLNGLPVWDASRDKTENDLVRRRIAAEDALTAETGLWREILALVAPSVRRIDLTLCLAFSDGLGEPIHGQLSLGSMNHQFGLNLFRLLPRPSLPLPSLTHLFVTLAQLEHVQQLAKHAPSLHSLTICHSSPYHSAHHSSDITRSPLRPLPAIPFPPLRTLKLQGVSLRDSDYDKYIYPLLIAPSMATLRTLHLEISMRGVQRLADLFTASFPSLIEFSCVSMSVDCMGADLPSLFPVATTLHLSMPASPPIALLPLPPQLTILAIHHVDVSNIPALLGHLEQGPLPPTLARLLVNFWDAYVGAPAALVQFCAGRGIVLLGNCWLAEAGADEAYDLKVPEAGDVSLESEAAADNGNGSEDYEDDWDAEDSELFREFWSKEKRDAVDAGERLS